MYKIKVVHNTDCNIAKMDNAHIGLMLTMASTIDPAEIAAPKMR